MCREFRELSALPALIASMAATGGAWRVAVPPEWEQGRTVYGGLVAGLAVETAQRALPGLGPLRAAQFAFVGPVSGSLVLTPTVLRAGRSVTFVSVDVGGDAGGVATRALLCFGAARSSVLTHAALPMPEVPAPDMCGALLSAEAPAFIAHFDARLALPGGFGSGSEAAEITAWFRHREADGLDPAVALVTLGDASPPAPLAMVDRFLPVSTMMWSVELGPDPGRGTPGGWRLFQLVGDAIADGYAAERITIWSEDGTPLMTARQSVAVFG